MNEWMNEWVLANLKTSLMGLGQQQENVRRCPRNTTESSRTTATALELKFSFTVWERHARIKRIVVKKQSEPQENPRNSKLGDQKWHHKGGSGEPNLGESLIFALLLEGASISFYSSVFQPFNSVLSQTQLQAVLGSKSAQCISDLQWMSRWARDVRHVSTAEGKCARAGSSLFQHSHKRPMGPGNLPSQT